MTMEDRPARWWNPDADGTALCHLCPRRCRIPRGGWGWCRARRNVDGALIAATYGRPTGFAVDPIEKKPLAHFHPGMPVLSFGTVGCNLGCKFCQNWSLSRTGADDRDETLVTPAQVVALARKHGSPGIAYTYNEPTIWGEYVADCARAARAQGLYNVVVSNGYITPEARGEVLADVDAANIDLKGFTERFYAELTDGHLEPVLDTLKWMVHETSIWLEITTLLIPGENDSDLELERECEWIARELSVDVPVHFTAFHPDYKLLDRPATPPARLVAAREIALRHGLRYPFIGNALGEQGHTTFCPGCKEPVIRRDWHEIRSYDLDGDRCSHCKATIAGRFDAQPPAGFFGRRRFRVEPR